MLVKKKLIYFSSESRTFTHTLSNNLQVLTMLQDYIVHIKIISI